MFDKRSMKQFASLERSKVRNLGDPQFCCPSPDQKKVATGLDRTDGGDRDTTTSPLLGSSWISRTAVSWL